jgi:Ca-activated chloride channel homolog
VDTFLLDSLSENHQGLSTYVQPDDPLDEILSEFYARISTPVLTNIDLDFDSMVVYDIYPQPLPDLFSGTQMILIGRYHDGGDTDITLSGEVNGERQFFTFPAQSFAVDSRGSQEGTYFLPRLWATRKIGYLLNSIRLHGPDQETIDQIVRLSIRYGIITPYTSYLVTESMPLGNENQERLAQETYQELQMAPAAPVYGQDAVEKASRQGALSQAEQAPTIISNTDQRQGVRIIGARTFVQSGKYWIDTAYDPERMKTQQVSFLSPEYFALANTRAEIAAALAQAENVILVVDGEAFEIVGEGAGSGSIQLPISLATPSPDPSQIRPVIIPDHGADEHDRPQPSTQLFCLGVPLALVLVAYRLRVYSKR